MQLSTPNTPSVLIRYPLVHNERSSSFSYLKNKQLDTVNLLMKQLLRNSSQDVTADCSGQRQTLILATLYTTPVDQYCTVVQTGTEGMIER